MRSLYDMLLTPQRGHAHKWGHYLPVYERYFAPLRPHPLVMLEIGVGQGGSLWAWQEYFPRATIIGLDINEECKKYDGGRVHVHIGSQADERVLYAIHDEYGNFDIIIDDGSHRCVDVKCSFNVLWPLLNHRGIYMIEDLQTSYEEGYGGGYRKKGTSMEMLKAEVDNMHYYGSSIKAMHFYRQLAVIEKFDDGEACGYLKEFRSRGYVKH